MTSINEMLDRKTLNAAPSLVAQFSKAEWQKTITLLGKAGFDQPRMLAMPRLTLSGVMPLAAL